MLGYNLLLASDVSDRDGLGLELYGPDGSFLAEIFRDDESDAMTFTAHRALEIPFAVFEEFVSKARGELMGGLDQ